MASLIRRIPLPALAAGLLVFAAGLGAAWRALPEWRAPLVTSPDVIRSVSEELRRAGGNLTGARFALTNSSPSGTVERAYRRLGTSGREWLAASGVAGGTAILGNLSAGEAGSGPVELVVAADGSIQDLTWVPGGSMFQFAPPEGSVGEARERFATRLVPILARGRPMGPETTFGSNPTFRRAPILGGSGPPEVVIRTIPLNSPLVSLGRQLVDPEAPERVAGSLVRRLLVKVVPVVLLWATVLVLFGVLLFRHRVSFRIGLPLTLLALLSMLLGGLAPGETMNGGIALTAVLVGRVGMLALLLVVWVVSESLLRDTVPGFTTSLDTFVARRLGPRGGRAVLGGLGMGAAAAGVTFLAHAWAGSRFAPAVRPVAFSFAYPLLAGTRSPLFEGPYHCAVFVLFVAGLRFLLPRPAAESAAALLFALLVSTQMPFAPWGAGFVLALAVAILYLISFRTYGFAALLVTTTAGPLLRDVFAAARASNHAFLPLAFCSFALLGLGVLGLVALGRSEREDEGRVDAPEYVKKVESERRVKYEMDLLSRMQLAMLPDRPPDVKGTDIAVRTVLATEAGGDLYEFIEDTDGHLWIAAGDVSGHGYSCGIQGAMVKAALLSLARDGRRPGEVLVEVDRVLRAAKAGRLFTSVVLLKIDPKNGEGLLANAGHPFPLLVHEGKCREVLGSGLPLGQGPPRTYQDLPIALAEGASLVLASDGLYEGLDRFDDLYGYDRPRTVLESVGLWRRPADAIVEALFADWRDHVGEGAPTDDTTVLVVKRPALAW